MYELVFGSQQPKTKEFRKHCCNVMFPHVRQQLTNKMKEEYQQAIKEKDNQIQALEDINEENQQKILRLNEEINDIIANRHIARRGCFDNVLCFIKKNSDKFTHTRLFDVSTDSWKNISDGLNFVTQTWRWLTSVMIQTPFTDGVDLSVK